MKPSNFIIFILAAMLPASCAVNTAPSGFLKDGYESQKSSYGGWIEIEYEIKAGISDKRSGEFIACDRDSVFIIDESGKFSAIPVPAIVRAKLTGFNVNTANLGVWVFAGIITTPAQGFFLLLTLPGWLLFGVIPTAAHSFKAQMVYPDQPFENLRKFARFPQGLPEDFNNSHISRGPGHTK